MQLHLSRNADTSWADLRDVGVFSLEPPAGVKPAGGFSSLPPMRTMRARYARPYIGWRQLSVYATEVTSPAVNAADSVVAESGAFSTSLRWERVSRKPSHGVRGRHAGSPCDSSLALGSVSRVTGLSHNQSRATAGVSFTAASPWRVSGAAVFFSLTTRRRADETWHKSPHHDNTSRCLFRHTEIATREYGGADRREELPLLGEISQGLYWPCGFWPEF